METSLPTPTTARVYVNLPEGKLKLHKAGRILFTSTHGTPPGLPRAVPKIWLLWVVRHRQGMADAEWCWSPHPAVNQEVS